jgi:hypothetical protein
MPDTIVSQMGDSPAQTGLSGILAKRRRAIGVEILIGYEDETGFHLGVNPDEERSRVPAG